MPAGTLHTWIKRHITVRRRLERICTGYLLFLMVATTKHSLTEAARFSGLPPSLFSKLLHSHAQVAITTLDQLSKRQARQFAKALPRVHGLPWKIVILIDSTLQHRASLHPENAKTFNHGKGYVRPSKLASDLWPDFGPGCPPPWPGWVRPRDVEAATP
jgi:hypothetical protein